MTKYFNIRDVRFQQSVLCVELMLGFALFFGTAWLLQGMRLVEDRKNVADLSRVAIELFIPYLGIALGGIFGTSRLGPREIDVYTFAIAGLSIFLWDLLAVGNLALVGLRVQVVEDVVQFADSTMPVISTTLAASIAYYFGAQTKAPGATTGDFQLPRHT
jgi:hypothetical protein